MLEVTVKIDGLDKLEAAMRGLPDKTARKDAGKALKAGAEIIADLMRDNVRVSDIEHPHLRDNIVISLKRTKGSERSVLVGFGKNVGWRAHFLEFGTRKMAARPFMRPAIDEGAEEAIHEIGLTLWEAIAKVAQEG